MLTSQKIQSSLFQSKQYSMDLLSELVTKRNQGEDICSLERKYLIFIKWIEILEDYLLENYDENGDIAEPSVVCLSADEISALMVKLKVMRGNNQYAHDPWLLATSFWRDAGFWKDGETWHDFIPIV